MVLAARPIGSRGIGDNTAQATSGAAPTPIVGDPITGADTVTFTGTATLKVRVALRTAAGPDLVFAGSATLVAGAALTTVDSATYPEGRLAFHGHARLSVEVATVAAPASTTFIKRISHTMPTPTLDANGRPT